MSIQTTTYKRRLRECCGLSPMARLVAITIADLRYERRLRENEPLRLTMTQLADACGMGSKNTARRWLDEAIASGWIIARAVFRDGRQQPNEYFISDPTAPVTEVKRLTSVIASGGQILRSSGRPISVKRLDTVLRSKNREFVDGDAAPRGGVGNEQGPIKTAPPAPPARKASEPDDAEPKPETRSWEEVEAQLLDDMQAEHRDENFGELATIWADTLTKKSPEQRRRERERDMIHRRRRLTTAANQRFEESA